MRHHEECKHTFDGAAATAKVAREYNVPPEIAEGDQRLQIAVMIRSDVFRECRARKINATPGPAEFFRVVNYTVAQHLARVPVALPDLAEVLDEETRSEIEAAAVARSHSVCNTDGSTATV